MLERDPDQRLGAQRGSKELKEHPWLASFPWSKLDKEQMKSPFIPRNDSNFN
jgi:protein-serine/threonine kinase